MLSIKRTKKGSSMLSIQQKCWKKSRFQYLMKKRGLNQIMIELTNQGNKQSED
jgi:hypothetical protein